MNIVNKHRSTGAFVGLCLAVSLLWSRPATAEVTLYDADGWTFSFAGRVDAFLSTGKGDDFPIPTVDPAGGMHFVMGRKPSIGVPDVGWLSSFQNDANNKYLAVRVRSGMYPNILGFALKRTLSDRTYVRAYVSIWSTVETLGRDKWAPVIAEAREGFFTVNSYWGSLTAGRMLGWLGRTSYEIDTLYGHGFGAGLPCTDPLGPACGHIGTGVLHPGYSAGVSYSTPSMGGLALHVAAFDPVTINNPIDQAAGDWKRGPYVRPEGAITFDGPLGGGAKLKVGVEGLWQQLGRTATDPVTMQTSNATTSMWGVAGGVRVEAGPLRVGAAAFRNRGAGLSYSGLRTSATADDDPTATAMGGLTYQLRTFTGFYGQAAVVFGRWQVGGGYGQTLVNQLGVDKANPNLSVIHTQTGISGIAYYHVSDSLVLALDVFQFRASWYGAPLVDAGTGQPTGGKLAGELQNLTFINLGATYHW